MSYTDDRKPCPEYKTHSHGCNCPHCSWHNPRVRATTGINYDNLPPNRPLHELDSWDRFMMYGIQYWVD